MLALKRMFLLSLWGKMQNKTNKTKDPRALALHGYKVWCILSRTSDKISTQMIINCSRSAVHWGNQLNFWNFSFILGRYINYWIPVTIRRNAWEKHKLYHSYIHWIEGCPSGRQSSISHIIYKCYDSKFLGDFFEG